MLKLDSELLRTVKDKEVQIDKNQLDAPDTAIKLGGLAYPIIKVSNTVLSQTDIELFVLQVGYKSPVPTAKLAFADLHNHFRETDSIDKAGEVIVWIGCATQEDMPPVKLDMRVDAVNSADGHIALLLSMRLPDERFSIAGNQTVREMLQIACKRSGLGLLCSLTDALDITHSKSYENVTIKEFLRAFMHDIGVVNWFIDGQYNLRVIDVTEEVVDHEPKMCEVSLYTGEELETAEPVKYSNSIERPGQFSFGSYDPIDMQRKPSQPKTEQVEFDISYTPGDGSVQLAEQNFDKFAEQPDIEALQFTARFDPYKQPGQTHDIEVWTLPGQKRVTTEQYDAGETVSMKQKQIEDLSGVYMLMHATYYTNNARLMAMTEYHRPTPEAQNDYKDKDRKEAMQNDIAYSNDYLASANELPKPAQPASVGNDSPAAPPTPSAKPGKASNNMQTAFQFFLGKGASRTLAAAIVGNLQAEGLSNIRSVGDSGKALGIAQWHAPRPLGMHAQLRTATLEQQLGFVWKELMSSHITAYKKAKDADLSEAVWAIMYYYEAPKDRAKGGPNHVKRLGFAKSLL